MLNSELEGNKKYFQANNEHSLFSEVQSIVRKYVGLDKIIEQIVVKLGDVKAVYLTGEWAKGKESEVIDLYLVGENIDKHYLLELIEKTEKLIGKKIKYLVYEEAFLDEDVFLLWEQQSIK
mgnify:FL=1